MSEKRGNTRGKVGSLQLREGGDFLLPSLTTCSYRFDPVDVSQISNTEGNKGTIA